MANTETATTDQTKAIEAASALILDTQEKCADTQANYVNSNVTVSLSVGPAGGGMQGNIHYTTGGQVYFAMEGKPTSFFGAFAGGGGLPLVGSLPADRLVGQTGTFLATGFGDAGVFQAWVNGTPVFSTPIPVVGPGFLGWELKGRIRFARVS